MRFKLAIVALLWGLIVGSLYGQSKNESAVKDAKTKVKLDEKLVNALDSIYENDQKYRNQLNALQDSYGWDSPEVKAFWKIINENDSINVIKVGKILDERGWLGADVVGDWGNYTLFLVIQHANLEIQEKYLPLMREAVKIGNADGKDLALLEDRVELRKGHKQIYGTQIKRIPESGEYYLMPLLDPDNVNKRRAEIGLGSIQDYISRYGLIWDVIEYKKRLPKYEEMQRR